jgi:hypothetical protein
VFFTPSPAPHHSSPPNLVVSDLITPQNSWNFPMLLSIFDAPSVKEIQKISISSVPSSNFIWTPSANGNFSANSTLKLINNPIVASSSAPLDPHVWKLLWKFKLNARLKLFCGKLLGTLSPQKLGLVLSYTFPLLTLFALFANLKLILSIIYSSDASLLELHKGIPFWPLDSQSWSSLSLPN